MDTITIISHCLPSPHQTTSPLQSDAGEHEHTSIQLSHPPNITSLNFYANLAMRPSICHMYFVMQPPSSYSDDPLDDNVLCSSISDTTLVLKEDQATDGVGVTQPTHTFIHEECDWELEHQNSAKDDSLLFEPPSFFPDIFGEPTIHDFACVSSYMDTPIVDHLQETLGVSPSSDNEEDKLFIENPLDLSSSFFRNTEDGFVCFSSTPLFDLLDHEDVDEIIDFLILDVVIYLLPYSITSMILSQLIFRSHLFMMIYLIMKLKSPRLSRHFSPS